MCFENIAVDSCFQKLLDAIKPEVEKPRPLDSAAIRVAFIDTHSTDASDDVGVWVVRERADWQSKCKKYVVAAERLVEGIGAAPRTVTEYAEKAQVAEAVPKCPHWGRGYMRKWTVRSVLLSLMTSANVPRLKVDDRCTAGQIVGMNPDQTSGLTRLRTHLLVTKGYTGLTGKQFLAKCGAGRPELFSMWLCFAIDRGLRTDDFENFDEGKWQAMAVQLHLETGVMPHVAASALA